MTLSIFLCFISSFLTIFFLPLSICVRHVCVTDPPSFIERPQNIESEMGENITMNCLVDSNPKADIVWVFDPIDRVS